MGFSNEIGMDCQCACMHMSLNGYWLFGVCIFRCLVLILYDNLHSWHFNCCINCCFVGVVQLEECFGKLAKVS